MIKNDELQISFLEVGQGDSIILEWLKEDRTGIGFFDCKRYQSNNPALQYLKNTSVKIIDFMVFSHPHSDHYSGFYELLQYCEKNNIIIREFYLTTQGKEYIAGATKRNIEINNLVELIKYIFHLCRNNVIESRYFIQGNEKIKLNSTFDLEFLSPTNKETDDFLASSFVPESESLSNNNSANLLSSISLISSDKSNILLTSDAEITSFKRIKQNSLINPKKKFLLGQVPHHGSKNNHFNEFWDIFKSTDTIPYVISCGNGKKHPNSSVYRYFNNSGKKVYLTRDGSVPAKPKGVIGLIAKKGSKPRKKAKSKKEDRIFLLSKTKVKVIN